MTIIGVDYEDLLQKYMEVVYSQEGTCFSSAVYEDEDFTDEEKQAIAEKFILISEEFRDAQPFQTRRPPLGD